MAASRRARRATAPRPCVRPPGWLAVVPVEREPSDDSSTLSNWLLLAQEAPNRPATRRRRRAARASAACCRRCAVIMVLFYFLILRPQKSKDQQFRSMVDNLKEKDRVVTIGGIHGVVTNVQRDAGVVTIRVDESTGTKIRVGTSAIAKVVTDEENAEATPTPATQQSQPLRSSPRDHGRSAAAEHPTNSFKSSSTGLTGHGPIAESSSPSLAAPSRRACCWPRWPWARPRWSPRTSSPRPAARRRRRRRRPPPAARRSTRSRVAGKASIKVAIVIALFVVPIFVGGWLAKTAAHARPRLEVRDRHRRRSRRPPSSSRTGEIKLGPDLSGGITLIYELAERLGRASRHGTRRATANDDASRGRRRCDEAPTDDAAADGSGGTPRDETRGAR